ncbi:hypothetical protein [Burkholderia cenocepacia]|uniref:hypothetical protein n=1 Tax=Burkholderia cenocepacia TaxID=95486 RepID=UPI0028640D29|nr:hypothetical protein [Burkholderia cenocepacia]MDR8049514.1 hypothetical protein [Burkholderia cenocepacia]MDV3098254.1 hypothetical protein [Burkholderia cenocepacia]
MKLPLSGMRSATAEWLWPYANLFAIAATIWSGIAAFANAQPLFVGLPSIAAAFAMYGAYIAGSVRERSVRRHLTAEQRRLLVATARNEGPGSIWIPSVGNDQEAAEYAKELRTAFDEAGWKTGYATLQIGTPIYGLVVSMGPPFTSANEARKVERIRRILSAAGMPSTSMESLPPKSPMLGWSDHPGPSSPVLLVASKPQK